MAAQQSTARSPVVRDVAMSIALFVENSASLPLTSNILLRGPRLDGKTYEQLGRPRTIINLRVEADDLSNLNDGSLVHLHCPMGNKSNVYDASLPQVRTWLADIFRHLETAVDLPIYVHCKHGRDRTGVVVGILLLILGAPKNAIMQEFLLTVGARMADLQRTLDGVKDKGGVEKYFEGMLDLEAVRRQLSFAHIQAVQKQLTREAIQAIKRSECPYFSCMSLLEACQCGLRFRPHDIEMHARLGWALMRLDRRDEAHTAFSKGLHLAATCNANPDVVKMMKHEIEALEATAFVHAHVKPLNSSRLPCKALCGESVGLIVHVDLMLASRGTSHAHVIRAMTVLDARSYRLYSSDN
eukprot:gnl/TRDRNA2_/TRDRNA2_195905_c0_seq1.p1 gnl/TRDRNA2_/TRDRNA2_195905_c0~~gnl/TRDRNA2_/TRDRNA2_195905_c0_seq1.p1  ORF type:complete len:378 (-),score=26.01 gnl/TRDRNA2_/TRDRNA2_195905_c0_seq1:85-1149(-)